MTLNDPSIATPARRPGRTRRPYADGTRPTPYRSHVESIGALVPRRRVSSREVLERCVHRPAIDIEGVTGIVERRMCEPGEDSLTLSVGAARDCLAHSKYAAEDLELIVFCGIAKYDSGVQHMRFEPGMSVMIRNAIGAHGAMTFDLGNACAGMMTGVHVVNDFVRRGAVHTGMIVSGEFITHLMENASRHVDQPRHPQTASLTLGDAGAAVILDRAHHGGEGIDAAVFSTLSEHVDLCTGAPCPTGPGAHMLTRAKEIHEQAIMGTPLIVQRALQAAGITFDQVDIVVTHQTAVSAIKKCSALVNGIFGSDRAKWIINVDRYGNTASTSHFVALRRLLQEGQCKRGERILLLTQASGLVLGAVVFTLDELGERYGRTN
ncbi:MAG: 3-oxoacyl-ACP synthase III family protein [Myxococcota bacterium]